MDQNAMDSKMLWINEGYLLDEAGNLISTSYVDLRAPRSRRTIQTLPGLEAALDDPDVSEIRCPPAR